MRQTGSYSSFGKSWRLFIGLGLASCLATSAVYAQTAPITAPVPAAATPGGALPSLPGETLPGLLDDAAFPIPPSAERPFGPEDGDRIFVNAFELWGF